MEHFYHIFLHYCGEVIPALAIGFFISGLVHELIPETAVEKYLGRGGLKPILYSTLIGALLPVCCWGSLPIAVSFHKKGARLGPILAFLVATPATSISALLVAYSVMGLTFAAYTFFTVIIMGVMIGLIGDRLHPLPRKAAEPAFCPHCATSGHGAERHAKKGIRARAGAVLRYAYVTLPREIGLELVIGLVLAAAVSTFVPVGALIRQYLGGWYGYLFSVIFGIVMYLCSTASVPLIDSFVRQGMNPGAGMTLLLLGPITSYGTILVLRKEFGMKVLIVFLAALIVLTLSAGLGYQALVGAHY